MSLLELEDAQQVAMVRLRLEGVPCRIVTRDEMAAAGVERTAGRPQRTAAGKLWRNGPSWPFAETSCVLYCRTNLQPGARVVATLTAQYLDIGYVLRDGIERALSDSHGEDLYCAALALRGLAVEWLASGGN